MIGGRELVLRSTKKIIGSTMMLVVAAVNCCGVFRGNGVMRITNMTIP